MNTSTRIASQKKVLRKTMKNSCIEVIIRYDDGCKNGHNTFSITGSLFRGLQFDEERIDVCGCIHDEIIEHFPELESYLKWQLCSSDGPIDYIADTIYHVKNGDFDNARRSAIWPEVTDEELQAWAETKNVLEWQLNERLPSLLSQFRDDMESLGFSW